MVDKAISTSGGILILTITKIYSHNKSQRGETELRHPLLTTKVYTEDFSIKKKVQKP